MRKLTEELSGKKVSYRIQIAEIPSRHTPYRGFIPRHEIILINGEGIIGADIGDEIEKYRVM